MIGVGEEGRAEFDIAAVFGGALMLACYLYALLSPHLKSAGLAAPEAEQIEEAAESQMPSA